MTIFKDDTLASNEVAGLKSSTDLIPKLSLLVERAWTRGCGRAYRLASFSGQFQIGKKRSWNEATNTPAYTHVD